MMLAAAAQKCICRKVGVRPGQTWNLNSTSMGRLKLKRGTARLVPIERRPVQETHALPRMSDVSFVLQDAQDGANR